MKLDAKNPAEASQRGLGIRMQRRLRANKLHKPQVEERAKLLRKKSSGKSETNWGRRSRRTQRGSRRVAN